MIIKLYNKILKEALDIMDFDSWDDTEKTFKNNIENSLKNNIFIYYNHPLHGNHKYAEQIQVFTNYWSLYGKYVDKVYDLNGKHVPIEGEGLTFEYFPTKKEYSFIIKDIDGVTDCAYMFYSTNIVEVPLFDTSKCKSMKFMFFNCKFLRTVPKLSLESIRNYSHAWHMFEDCVNVDDTTEKIWGINFSKGGSINRWKYNKHGNPIGFD